MLLHILNKETFFMIRFVHSNPKFEKMLNAMRTSEKMAVSAAKKPMKS